MGFSTDAIHGGQKAEEVTGSVIPPVFLTSTYAQKALGEDTGYLYSRLQNPTREALERNVAVLERGKYGLAFSSGLAAIDAVLRLFEKGDEVVVTDNVYGGTYRLFENILKKFGLSFTFIDSTDLANVEQTITNATKLVFIETPTNPLLKITDIRAVAGIAHSRGILLAVDNTFLSPYNQSPLELGADIVVHSATKYLNGHSDMVGGLVITSNSDVFERIQYIRNSSGAVPGPLDSWLALRGIKTLAVRMRQHEENARHIARYLETHRIVERVIYPGLPSHPQHELAKTQSRGFGGIISIDVGTIDHVRKILNRVEIFTLAESLGGVESLISHPATMTHASVPKEKRDALGVTEGLIRLSVGIEDVEDIKSDLEHALSL